MTRGAAAACAPLLALLALVAALSAQAALGGTDGAPRVTLVELDTAIDKVSARFLERALEEARDEGAGLVVVRLDTPGGLLSATRDMVADIFASSVPVAVYVAPEGAQAASASTFIAASAAVLAMAPATNIGAAAVVGGQGQDLPETLERKANQDAAAFLESIASRRGRPIDALRATVLEARSYAAEEALRLGIADLSAPNLRELLSALDGRQLGASGGAVEAHTAGAGVHEIDMNVFERVLSFLADPNGAAGTVALVLAGLFLAGFTGAPGLPGPSSNVSTWLVVAVGAVLGLATLWLAWEFRRSRRAPAYASPYAQASLVGQLAEVSVRLAPLGEVRIAGEAWSAELEEGNVAEVGELVRVTALRELCLVVRRLTLHEVAELSEQPAGTTETTTS